MNAAEWLEQLDARFPRAKLAVLPTPLDLAENLSNRLEGPRIYIKRDDLTGLALGGDKPRKLEYLLGEALQQGADTVITGGSSQSNHVRLTAAAARKLGMKPIGILISDAHRQNTSAT